VSCNRPIVTVCLPLSVRSHLVVWCRRDGYCDAWAADMAACGVCWPVIAAASAVSIAV
jgi:hypothetical protein